MRELKYGKGTLNFSIPSHWKSVDVKIKEKEPIYPIEDVFFRLLENPIGERPFSQWIKDHKKVLIIVPDITRYAGVDLLLPLLYRRYLVEKDVSILFALGNHRKHTEGERIKILTEEIYKAIPSFDHDCFSSSSMSFFGVTRSGIPVYLNSLLSDADCAIVFGSINFHYLAGFGGGRKAIIPGISGYDTIIGVHKKVFKEKGKHELAKPGVLDGNPMHEEIISGIKLINKPLFLINTVVDDSNILAIFSGDVRKAHALGCNWYMDNYGIQLKEKADVIITSAGGYPKDINFIQTHKAIEHAVRGVRKGGYIIVLGACEDGIGNEHFLEFFDYGTSEDMEKVVKESDKVYSQTAYATKLKAEYCNIILISELSESSVLKMGLIPKKSVADAITMIDDGSEKHCYIVKDGYKTLIVSEGGDGV